ncbi:MAG: LysR family transcriptional regulator [Alphaproteobacteria bacterium]|nr:LysR family transcriptional regulator [Alphaproteobacteria bacterium]
MNWNRIPSLAGLRAFEAAARCLSFSKAAKELNVTHAAIAQHVRNLEADFSESLLVRQGRGLALTANGVQLAESLQVGFDEIARGVENLRAKNEDRPLNITITPAFATSWLMPRIGEFWANHPDISLNLNPSIGLVDIIRDSFDLAIRFGDGNWPNLTSELLTDGDFWVVSHPDLIRGRAVNCLGDVTDLPWILESQMMERRAIIEREGIDFENVDIKLMDTNGMVISGALAGLGVTVQPKSLVQAEIKAGALAKICEIRGEGLGYYLVTVPNRAPKGLKVFRAWLRSAAARDA